MKSLSAFLLLSLVCLALGSLDLNQNKFVYVNPGQSNYISVAPLSISEARSLNNFEGSAIGYTYSWRGLPSWASSNGSSFYGTVPAGSTGTQQISVQYSDASGNIGTFSFLLNYGGLGASGSTAGGSGSLNIINGVSSGTFSIPSGATSQLVLIPGLVNHSINTRTLVTANTQVITAGDGSRCNSILV